MIGPAWRHVELFLIGLCMASQIDPTMDPSSYDHTPGPQDYDFLLWIRSWDILKPEWDRLARDAGWRAVGMNWEYHDASTWRD